MLLKNSFFFTCHNLIWKVGCGSNCINNARQTNLTFMFADCAVLFFFLTYKMISIIENSICTATLVCGARQMQRQKFKQPSAHQRCTESANHSMLWISEYTLYSQISQLRVDIQHFLVCMRTIRSLPVSFAMIML